MFKHIKILIVIGSLKLGGSERFVLNVARLLNLQKFEVTIVLLKGCVEYRDDEIAGVNLKFLFQEDNSSKQRKYTSKIKKCLLNTLSLLTLGIFDNLFYLLNFGIYKKLFLIISEYKPHIIIALNEYPIIFCAILRIFSRLEGKLIFTVRTLSSYYLSNYKRFPIAFLLKFLLSYGDSVLAQRETSVIDLKENFKVKPHKIRTIRNLLDMSLINTYSKEMVFHKFCNGNNDIILAIGNLEENKGYSFLIRAFEIVLQQFCSAKLIIIGEGPFRCKLECLIRSLNIDDSVDIIGMQNNPFKYFKFSRVFVSTSLWEGVPNSILESMICGVPVVAFAFSGIEEIIIDGETGLITPAKNIKLLSDAICLMIKNEQLRNKIVSNARRYVASYNTSEIVSQYENYFLDMYKKV